MSTGRAKVWAEQNPDKARQQKLDQHERLKREIFDAYGGKCVCCNESDLHFLTIDHIDGVVPDRHRQKDGRRLSGTAFLYKLRNENYPDDCRILCWNCNCSYAYYGFCPHQPHTLDQRRYREDTAPVRKRQLGTETHCGNGHNREMGKPCPQCHRDSQKRYLERKKNGFSASS